MSQPATESQEESLRPAAFFDMDKTVLRCNSAGKYVRYLYKRGELGMMDVVRTARWLMQYHLAMIDAESVTKNAISTVRGTREEDMVSLCETWFEEEICDYISKRAVEVIERHRAKGHPVILLTAATPYIANPVSEHLNLDAAIATQLEVGPDGLFTGEAVQPLCYGEGKIHWASAWAKENQIDLKASYFYTDSFTDKPMLDEVGFPVAINPDPRLKRYAKRASFPIEIWD